MFASSVARGIHAVARTATRTALPASRARVATVASVSRRCMSTAPLTTLSEEEEMMKEAGVCVQWPVLRMGCRPRAIQDWFYTCSRVGIACLATVARFAREEIAPKVREMDDSMTMDSDVIQGLFDQGVRRGVVAVVCIS